MIEVELKAISLDTKQISALLPHRYPFLLLDKVTRVIPGQSAIGIKNVTINEPFFQGHFVDNPIMPGVLIIEALAQLTAVINGINQCIDGLDYDSIKMNNIADKVGYLAEVKHIRFHKLVVPGDQLLLKAEKKVAFGKLSNFEVKAYVDNEQVVTGTLTVSEK